MPQPLMYTRKVLGVGTEELALEAGCSPSTVSLIENGKRQPSRELKSRIVKAMRKFIRPDVLFYR